MTINTPSFRATAALIGLAALTFTPAAQAQTIPRMGVVSAPVGGFRGAGATASGSASLAAATMMPEISSWESVFAAPSIGINSALPASAAAPAAMPAAAATPFSAASIPESTTGKTVGAPAAQPAAIPSKTTATSGVEARIAPRLAEVESFRSGPKDAELAAAPSGLASMTGTRLNTVKPASGASASAVVPAAQHPFETAWRVLPPAAAAGIITFFGTTWAQSVNDPGAGILVLLAAVVGGGLVFAVQGIIDMSIAIHTIDSAHAADLTRRKKALGID